MKTDVRKGVVLIVRNKDGNYLLLRHKSNKQWSMISGGIEPGESAIEAVLRESKEESGLTINPKHATALRMTIEFVNKHGKGEQEAFFCEVADPEIKVDNREISSFGWFSQSELLKVLKSKPPLVKLFTEFVGSTSY